MKNKRAAHSQHIAALIATRPRWASLRDVAIPSLLRQVHLPDLVVIVRDRIALSERESSALHELVGDLPLEILFNSRAPGAAGAWNTGLAWLQRHVGDGFVAILDDDDEWDSDHLSSCHVLARDGVDVILSGLRMVQSGHELSRAPLSNVSCEDFLTGNPGWQGSNTFAKLQTMMRVGGFTDGLPSANDRDLAVRLLSLPDLSVAYTGRMTATWHMDAQPDALSRRGGHEKREGLEQFLRLTRLNKVMQQAALLQVSGVLGRHAGPQVKQGTCHLLANEGVMPWDR